MISSWILNEVISEANPLNPLTYEGSVGTVTFFFCLVVLLDYAANFFNSFIESYLSSPPAADADAYYYFFYFCSSFFCISISYYCYFFF